MDPIKVAFFTHSEPNTPLEYLRIIGPISFTDCVLFSGPNLLHNINHYINESDLIVIQRSFPADFNTFLQILETSRILKKPLVYDFDDNLFIMPENHPDRKSFEISNALLPMLFAVLKVDYLTVTNDYIKEKFKGLNKNIYVLPNYLDDSIWKIKPPIKRNNKSPLTIGYMGGNSHEADIKIVIEPLISIKEQFQDDVRFLFYGIKPPDELESFPDTIWNPTKTYNYREFAQDLANVDVDIFIAPLVDNEFSRCKSPIKFLEYSVLGIPGVYSRTLPYNKIISDGENGLLASDPEEWKNKIEILIKNPDLRYELAKNAQNFISENYLMSENSDKWKITYQEIITQGLTNQNSTTIPISFIEAITPQINEYQVHISKENLDLKTRLNKAESKQKSLQSKILQHQKKINKQNNELAFLSEELSSLQNKILLRDEKIADYEDIASNLKNEITTSRNEITSLQNEITTIRNEDLKLKNVIIDRDRKINELNIEINHLKEEVLFYALSRSWRFTRPLRKIMKKIRALRK